MFIFKKKNNLKKAFTLVELLVVISIFSLISISVFYNHSKFSSRIKTENLAYEVAISIRQAQFYGLNVRGQNNVFDVGYGVHFDKDDLQTYILFSDLDGDKSYDTGEAIDIYTIPTSQRIKQFCGYISVSSTQCNPTIESLDIVFTRPDPEADISSNLNTYALADIIIESLSGEDSKTVQVGLTGQISIQ